MTEETRLCGHRTVTKEAVATFAALTGDYSRIHLDHRLGQSSTWGSGFAHGLLGASWALGAMTLHAPERVGAGDPTKHVSSFAVRFDAVVRFEDTLAFRFSDAPAQEDSANRRQSSTPFEVLNQEDKVVARGQVTRTAHSPETAAGTAGGAATVDDVWPKESAGASSEPTVGSTTDLVARGPRGALPIRTLTETDVVNFTGFTGELNPLYLDTVFSSRALFGKLTIPPMLCFALGFSTWLREFLRQRGGAGESTGSGHLGDRWQWVAPVYVGDTLEVRHRPLSVRPTRSNPARGVMTFGLQLLNQHQEIVLRAEVDMMLDMPALR